MSKHTTYLFAYGTLLMEKVQLETFGRLLTGTPDVLKGFVLEKVEIKEPTVLQKSQLLYHPIAVASENPNAMVTGTAFELNTEELHLADSYEVDDYKRIKVVLESGKEAWVFVKACYIIM